MQNGEQVEISGANLVRIAGRITFRRDTSNKLIFYSVRGVGSEIQVMANFKFYEDKEDFPKINEILRRGDVIGIIGVAGMPPSATLHSHFLVTRKKELYSVIT